MYSPRQAFIIAQFGPFVTGIGETQKVFLADQEPCPWPRSAAIMVAGRRLICYDGSMRRAPPGAGGKPQRCSYCVPAGMSRNGWERLGRAGGKE